MRHHGRIDAFERAAIEQQNLASAALFGGRSHKDDSSGQLRGNRIESRDRAQRGARDQVMTTRVTVGQRVILREDRDRRPFAASELGAKRGLQLRDSVFHAQPQAGCGLGKLLGGEVFFEFRFRMVVD